MRLLTGIFLLACFQLKAQIFIDPYVQGEFRNDVVYIGSYDSPGSCTIADGIDFQFDFSGLLLPDGMEFVLIIDEPVPSNTALINGWLPVNVGDSTTFTPSTTDLGISAASGPATIHFHIRAIGTTTASGQEYTCWIDQVVTLSSCGNTYALLSGETLVPCYVAQPLGIDELENPIAEMTHDKTGLSITSQETGTLSIFDIDGRVHFTKKILPGFTHLGLNYLAKGHYVARFDGQDNRTISKIILLQ